MEQSEQMRKAQQNLAEWKNKEFSLGEEIRMLTGEIGKIASANAQLELQSKAGDYKQTAELEARRKAKELALVEIRSKYLPAALAEVAAAEKVEAGLQFQSNIADITAAYRTSYNALQGVWEMLKDVQQMQEQNHDLHRKYGGSIGLFTPATAFSPERVLSGIKAMLHERGEALSGTPKEQRTPEQEAEIAALFELIHGEEWRNTLAIGAAVEAQERRREQEKKQRRAAVKLARHDMVQA